MFAWNVSSLGGMCNVIVKDYRRKLVILLSPQDQIFAKNLNVLSTKSFGTVLRQKWLPLRALFKNVTIVFYSFEFKLNPAKLLGHWLDRKKTGVSNLWHCNTWCCHPQNSPLRTEQSSFNNNNKKHKNVLQHSRKFTILCLARPHL